MEVFLSISETANLLDITERAVQKNCKAKKYLTQQVKGRGGLRYEIALTSLPKQAQTRYQNQQLAVVIEQVTSKEIAVKTDPVVDSFQYTERQRKIGGCRKRIITFIQQSGMKVIPAIDYLNSEWQAGTLPSEMKYALEHASDKGQAVALSRGNFYNWEQQYKKTDSYAPSQRQKDMTVKPWHRMAIALYGRPQKPTFTYVEEKLAEHFNPAPTYQQIRDFFNHKYSQADINKGRHTGLALKEKGFFNKRTHAGMQPWDEMQADGWATHFTAPHPVTKHYVTFEVWDFHDVATRYVPPFAIGASECFEVIAKGIELAIREGGVMAILQTDSTKIVKNNAKFSGNPLLSISDRAGLTIVHPQTVGNAPANGISENFHAQLDRWSRELATYQARGTANDKGMDSSSLRRVQKLTAALVKAESTGDKLKVDELRREIAKTGKGILFESYQDAVDWLDTKRVTFNNTPHSALDKITDPITGKKRHQTPQECLDAFKANGWTPYYIDEAEIIDLFRPRVIQKVRAHVVKPYHKDVRFYHRDLAHYEGKEVLVSYDIMDYTQVWVYDLQGSLIVVAPHCADVMYRSLTAAEASKATRDLAKVKRLELKIDGIQAESVGVLDYIEGELVPPVRVLLAQKEEVEDVKQLTRAEFLLKMAVWKKVDDEDDEDDFNQQHSS
ncbi:MAG: Mu transposase C-terminal domain-containing protein [Methylococcales bacterium]|nr:Mu transposase C-terminal domain-containing protein [Methylococcales bacterium]